MCKVKDSARGDWVWKKASNIISMAAKIICQIWSLLLIVLPLLTLSITWIVFLMSSLWIAIDLHSLSLLYSQCPDPLTEIYARYFYIFYWLTRYWWSNSYIELIVLSPCGSFYIKFLWCGTIWYIDTFVHRKEKKKISKHLHEFGKFKK